MSTKRHCLRLAYCGVGSEIEGDQDNSDAGQLALMTALVTGVAKSFKLILPNGNTATFTAYVKKFNSQGAVDQAIRRSAELRISGSITWA